MHFDWQFFWKSLVTPSGPFLNGLMLTIVISVVAMVLATALGLIVALMRRSRFAGLAGAPASTSGSSAGHRCWYSSS